MTRRTTTHSLTAAAMFAACPALVTVAPDGNNFGGEPGALVCQLDRHGYVPHNNKLEGTKTLTRLADRSTCKVDDLPVFTAKSDSNCLLALINIDAGVTDTVIFPNKFQQDNAIKAGNTFRFPGDDAPFRFPLKGAGKGKVITLCNPTTGEGQPIAHNHETAAFISLGNYEKLAI